MGGATYAGFLLCSPFVPLSIGFHVTDTHAATHTIQSACASAERTTDTGAKSLPHLAVSSDSIRNESIIATCDHRYGRCHLQVRRRFRNGLKTPPISASMITSASEEINLDRSAKLQFSSLVTKASRVDSSRIGGIASTLLNEEAQN